MAKTRLGIIVNPFAGGRDKSAITDQLEAGLSTHFEVSIHPSLSADDPPVLAKKLADEQTDVVVIVGGDGTVNQVAAQLIGTKTRLAIIPQGSGNGLARHLGLYTTTEALIQLIIRGHSRAIDVCFMNEVPFFNIAGIGLDACVAYETKANKSRGFWPYFTNTLKAFFKYEGFVAKINSAEEASEKKFLNIIVSNGSIYGYQFIIAPIASVADAKLDVLLIDKQPWWRFLSAIPHLLRRQIHKSAAIDFTRSETFEVHLMETCYAHLDGEGMLLDKGIIRFSQRPASLQVIIPEGKVI